MMSRARTITEPDCHVSHAVYTVGAEDCFHARTRRTVPLLSAAPCTWAPLPGAAPLAAKERRGFCLKLAHLYLASDLRI
jgi:hypothetical protein